MVWIGMDGGFVSLVFYYYCIVVSSIRCVLSLFCYKFGFFVMECRDVFMYPCNPSP